ncbi:MAG: VOC family protein [Alphaproteobacteria bacterium]|nr:VOC family protein [Pseudomonadota bacterium]TDI64771.1 MAG: VOC family protein [Alphaproteobacteria bacterium]
MPAKINHVAIVSENYAILGQFYQAVFGMKSSGHQRPGRAITVGDGYVGLNINPRREGRQARLDHFGIEVDDAEAVLAKMAEAYPSVTWLRRPSTRPFAGITTHDPDGNVFDISQKDMTNRADLYAAEEWQQDRTIDHVALRTMNAEAMAKFYADLFGFAVLNKGADDANFYLSDGRMTLELIPWDVRDSEGMSIIMPGMDHIGFKVESLDALKEDIDAAAANPQLRPVGLGLGAEGAARLERFHKTCPLGTYHMADSDGVLIDVAE